MKIGGTQLLSDLKKVRWDDPGVGSTHPDTFEFQFSREEIALRLGRLQARPDPDGLNDTVSINLQFENGSVGTVCYFANGSKSLSKEYLEVHQSGQTGILRDFKELEVHRAGKPFRKKLLNQDKGQAGMVKAFVERVRDGGAPLIPFDEIVSVTRATLSTLDSLKNRQAYSIGSAEP